MKLVRGLKRLVEVFVCDQAQQMLCLPRAECSIDSAIGIQCNGKLVFRDIWGIVKIMVPCWVPTIIRGLI